MPTLWRLTQDEIVACCYFVFSLSPALMMLPLILLAFLSFSTVVPLRLAISMSVSPFLTVTVWLLLSLLFLLLFFELLSSLRLFLFFPLLEEFEEVVFLLEMLADEVESFDLFWLTA